MSGEREREEGDREREGEEARKEGMEGRREGERGGGRSVTTHRRKTRSYNDMYTYYTLY